jgi:hypothetical protein
VDKARVGPWDGKRKVVLDRSLKPPSVKGSGGHIAVAFLLLLLLSLGNSNNSSNIPSLVGPCYVLSHSECHIPIQ